MPVVASREDGQGQDRSGGSDGGEMGRARSEVDGEGETVSWDPW